jgi:hypothetical protein
MRESPKNDKKKTIKTRIENRTRKNANVLFALSVFALCPFFVPHLFVPPIFLSSLAGDRMAEM